MPDLSQDAFVEANADLCPCCSSSDITETNTVWAEKAFYVVTQCEHCRAEWQAVARLVGYELLEDPRPAGDPNGSA